MRVWELGPGRLTFAGGLDDLALHHHPAVQVTLGLAGPLSVTAGDDVQRSCRLVVVPSGKRHAVQSNSRSDALSIYLGPHTWPGTALQTLSRTRGQAGGVWIVGDGQKLADATAAALAADGPRAAGDFLISELCGTSGTDPGERRCVHPQLRQAIDLVSSSAPSHFDLESVAGAVALSPDYLGRLCKQQTGVSFSATTRWARLVNALRYLTDGAQITDAAHLAGFADGSHATRVCREMAGASPSDIVRALRDSQVAAQPSR